MRQGGMDQKQVVDLRISSAPRTWVEVPLLWQSNVSGFRFLLRDLHRLKKKVQKYCSQNCLPLATVSASDNVCVDGWLDGG